MCHLSYPDSPNIAYHDICCRCFMEAEYSIIGYGYIPIGINHKIEESNRIILCLDCTELFKNNITEFWNNGWDRPIK